VEDCVEALRLAAERYDGADPVNVGTGEEIRIRDLCALIADVTGFAGQIRWDTSKPNGQPRRRLDTTRAERLFGFRARVPLREGIERTVAWYRAARVAGVGC
jgi:GDP-L-fucose synthase